MRQILLSILFAGVVNATIAQTFTLGVNGGFSYSTAAQSLDKQTEIFWSEAQPQFSPFASIKGTVTLSNWQLGLSLQYQIAKYRSESWNGIIDRWYPNGYVPTVEPRYVNLQYASLMPVRAFMNRQISFNKLGIYGGVAASYIITPNRGGRPWFGYAVGAQCGAFYPMSKHISVNVEVTGDKMWFKQQSDCLLTMYNTTASLGLTYRLK